jgi:hypothetical protein
MVKRFIAISLLFTSFSMNAQQQIRNSNMELWDNIGQAIEEPSNWNSFRSAQGSFTSFASQQVQRSTSTRAGASGQYCARIWSKSTLGVVANGNLTLGRINMGSTTADNPNNYNISLTADTNFSEVITTAPDSLVFWVKFTPQSGNQNARVHAILHDAYDLRDPIDANSATYVVSRAELNYPSTNGQWVRKSVPFVNTGSATTPQFLLITFTTNQTPGGGAADDEVLLDDIQLVYNPSNNNLQITASNDSDVTAQGSSVTINVVANDNDPENNIDLASLTILSQPTNGTAQANSDGTITYSPNAAFYGSDNFTYQICDLGSPVTCASGIVNITVNQVGGIGENNSVLNVFYTENGLQFSTHSEFVNIINSKGENILSGEASLMTGTILKSGIYFIQSSISTVKLLVP